jgi:hypothetical protein
MNDLLTYLRKAMQPKGYIMIHPNDRALLQEREGFVAFTLPDPLPSLYRLGRFGDYIIIVADSVPEGKAVKMDSNLIEQHLRQDD